MKMKKKTWRGCFSERSGDRSLMPVFPRRLLQLPFAVPGDFARLMTIVCSKPRGRGSTRN